jgi:hypothetical protein
MLSCFGPPVRISLCALGYSSKTEVPISAAFETVRHITEQKEI